MKKFAKKFSFIVLASALAASTLVGCSQEEAAPEKTEQGNESASTDKKEEGSDKKEETAAAPKGTIVVATEEMNGVFSPFFYTTGYDANIIGHVHEGLIAADRLSTPIPNLADFTIEEIKEGEEVKQTVYTFTLKENLVFSDGEPITADDVMFSYKVYLDPTYDGMATISTLPIVGLAEYREGDATEISGIEKVDDRTVKITLDGIDPAAIWKLGISIAPEHYYGEGFEKGNLAGVKEKNDVPVGAGAYMFEKFENNVVTLVANTNYFKGSPSIEKIKYQVTDTANKLEAVKANQVDISDPSASPEMVTMVEEAGYHYELVDNLGYGYIGINKDRVTDLNVRKGLMHLMNRKPAVDAYYGDLATVIERPMTTVTWAYPQGAEEYYGYNPDKALEYFTAAGYTNEGGKLVKDGEQLRLEIAIPGGGVMDHPTAPVLTQMKTDMEAMGAVLEIVDTDGTVFFDKLNAEEWDMWVAAWGASNDPDMYQIYHTDGATTRFNINNPDLDKLIEDARKTNDIAVRTELYGEALDIIMDEAVEMPVYQRKNMFVFNQDMIDITTLPADMTPYYTYFAEIESLEMAK